MAERRRPGRDSVVAVFVAVIALSLAGCISPTVLPTPPPSAAPDLSRFYEQSVSWRECGKVECAEVVVPVDYSDPGGETLRLKVVRNPATIKRVGTIFVNPGGPGAAGSETAKDFERSGLEAFDIVGWDPRGTGESSGMQCLSAAELDAFFEVDISPDDQAEREELLAAGQRFGAACLAKYPALAQHVSTTETAKDLDVLRGVLGEEKLNYLGYSYGTYLGAVYGVLFPDRVGRLVLDAPVDLTPNTEVIQAQGFDVAIGNFAKWCVGRCELGDSAEQVLVAVTRLFDELDAKPLAVGERRLTQSLAVSGVASWLYAGTETWPKLAKGIREARAGDGRVLLRGSDLLNGRDQNGNYGPLVSAFPAISCLDKRDGSVAKMWEKWTTDQEKAPIFGKYLGPDLMCAAWPVPSVVEPKFGRLPGQVLVVAATGDNATPYPGAVNTARLVGGRLLTYEGEGHCTYGGKSKCVDEAVVRLFAEGALPSEDLVCR